MTDRLTVIRERASSDLVAAHPGTNFAKDHFFPPSLLQQQRTLTLTLNSVFELRLELAFERSLTTPASRSAFIDLSHPALDGRSAKDELGKTFS